MLLALTTVPALLGTNEAIRQGQTKDRREEHRARRSNLIVSCVDPSPRSIQIDHRQVGLKNNKVFPPNILLRCIIPKTNFLILALYQKQH